MSAKDIGAVAFRALTDAEAWNKDVRVLGPDLLKMDDVRRLSSLIILPTKEV